MGLVRLRLARWGRKNLPFYRITAADSRAPRDGKHLEVVGHYNPLPGKDGLKRIGIHTERVKYWLSVGAQPSPPVARLLFFAGILPKPPTSYGPRKTYPPKTPPTPTLEAGGDQAQGENESQGENQTQQGAVP